MQAALEKRDPPLARSRGLALEYLRGRSAAIGLVRPVIVVEGSEVRADQLELQARDPVLGSYNNINNIANTFSGEPASGLLDTMKVENTTEGDIAGSLSVAALGMVLGGGGSAKGLASATRTTKVAEGRLARWPKWKFGNTGNAAAKTDKFGNITIARGLKQRELLETLRHESVHSRLSPRRGSFAGELRADFRMNAYKNSHLVRYMEEALAEGWATRSMSAGLKYPLNGYDISLARVGVEGMLYGGIVLGPVGFALSSD